MKETPSKTNGLTRKRRRFAHEYVIDHDGAKAAIRAKYSPKGAAAQAAFLLTIPAVAALIDELDAAIEVELGITAKRVLDEIAKMAFVNVQDFYEPNGKLKRVVDLPRDVAAALSSTKTNITLTDTIEEIKLHDKRGSLELLGRHLKLFTDKHEHTGKDGEKLDLSVNFVVPGGNSGGDRG